MPSRGGTARPPIPPHAVEERCEKSGLFPSACAHCRGLTLDPALVGLAEVQVLRRYRARASGTCPSCRHEYANGDLLAEVGEGVRICERCAP
ncbi:hypothetical protein AB0425_17810 [Actinosynnema sp. NPDC051121]